MVYQKSKKLVDKKDETRTNSRRGVLSGVMAIIGMATGGMKPAHADGQFPIRGEESIMSQKAHGTSQQAVQQNLKFKVNRDTADRISNYNRNRPGFGGKDYKKVKKSWIKEMVANGDKEYTFFDSVTGKPLFVAPRGRTMKQFITESYVHGWSSFRDSEVVWDNVRVLKNGETVSLTGTHLGWYLPDRSENRYSIDLVSIAGNKSATETSKFQF